MADTRQRDRFDRGLETVTLGTMILNTLLFWTLSSGLGIYYLASQVITIGVIVPINFALNRSFTFAA